MADLKLALHVLAGRLQRRASCQHGTWLCDCPSHWQLSLAWRLPLWGLSWPPLKLELLGSELLGTFKMAI